MLKQLLIISLFACYSSSLIAVQAVNVELQTSASANLNDAKQASPLPISLFVLANSEKFSKLGYFSLEDNSRSNLGAAYLSKRSYVMVPNARKRFVLNAADGARYLGIVGGYNNLKGKRWRRVIKLSDVARKNITIRFNRQGVQLTYADKAVQTRQGFYFDGNFSYGFLSPTSTEFQYSASNRAKLDINSAYMLGELGMGGGYQWLLNGVVQKFSVGAGLYYTPATKVAGNVVSNLMSSSQETTRAFTVNSNNEKVMLESRVNFLRFAKHFTNYFNVAIGMIFYNSQYARNTSSGILLEKDHRNSDMIYTLGAGVEYDLDEHMSLSLGYEYNSPTKLEVQEVVNTNLLAASSPDITINNSAISFKLRYLV